MDDRTEKVKETLMALFNRAAGKKAAPVSKFTELDALEFAINSLGWNDSGDPDEDGEYMIAWVSQNPANRGKKAFMEFCEFQNGQWLTDTIKQGRLHGGVKVVAWRELPENYEIA